MLPIFMLDFFDVLQISEDGIICCLGKILFLILLIVKFIVKLCNSTSIFMHYTILLMVQSECVKRTLNFSYFMKLLVCSHALRDITNVPVRMCKEDLKF